MNASLRIDWTESDQPRSALWRSESGHPAPRRVQIADDRMAADTAYRLVCEGTALLWRGDFQNARQLLQALARRVDRKPRKAAASLTDAFHQNRQAQAQRAHVLGMLLIELDASYGIALRRAPDMREACEQAYGPASAPSVVSLRELQGLVGAYEWRRKGVDVPAAGGRIHPHYGVFSPVRGEYIELLGKAALPSPELAFDIGTGTGVLAAVLARRGVRRVVATDLDARALACARENVERLGLRGRVEVVQADLFPPGRAPLLVCNPPWIPARPASKLEQAIYDPESRMLRGFLTGARDHLTPGGEAWLVMSDFAERLGLRSRDMLPEAIAAAGLRVLQRHDTRPTHSKPRDAEDPLHAARSAEITSLWRLGAA